jgi:hypothetical protein
MSAQLFIHICGVLSAVLPLWAIVPYVRSILRGRTKPHQFSWLIFTIMSGITLASQLASGAGASALLFAVFFFDELVVLLLSFKYGVKGTSRFDRLLLTLSLFTILIWIVTRDTTLAVWLTAAIDIPATTMTVLKVRKDHGSEAAGPWIIASVACIFSILTLVKTPFGILYVRPIYALLSEAAIAVAALVYRAQKVQI